MRSFLVFSDFAKHKVFRLKRTDAFLRQRFRDFLMSCQVYRNISTLNRNFLSKQSKSSPNLFLLSLPNPFRVPNSRRDFSSFIEDEDDGCNLVSIEDLDFTDRKSEKVFVVQPVLPPGWFFASYYIVHHYKL